MYNSIIPFLSCVLAAKAISLPGGSLDKRQDYSGQEIQLTFFGYPDNCDDVCDSVDTLPVYFNT